MAILRNKETVEILKDLVESITLKVSGKDGAAWVDNLDGTYTLEVCKTYWFTVGDRFEDSVLLGIYHTITEVVKDTSITISSTMLPTNNEATLPTPLFYNGTIIAGTNELTNIRNHETESRPIIYLLEQFDETYFNEESSYDRISNLRLFFLLDSSYSWETPEHYTKVINPIRTLVNYFIDTVIKGNKLFDSEEIQEIDTTTRVRFGVYTSDRGTLVKALNEDYSGIEIRFSLPMFKTNACCGDTIEYATCREASFEVKNTEGALLDSGTIPSGGYQLIEINTASCEDVTYNITRDGEPFASGSEPSGGSININVPSDCPPPEPCADGTVNVQQSDATPIASVTVASGGTAPYLVADSIVNVNAVKLADVKATDTLSITVVDSNDDAVAVTLSGENKIIVDDLPCSGGTCAEAYQLVNHTTLNRNNPFGNTNRFTAPDGTQTYTDGIVLDWFQADDDAETVPMYGVSLLSANSLANHLAGEPYTLGSYNNFVLIQIEDLFRLVNPRASAVTDGLNYSPFNHQATTNASRVRSKTDFYASTTDNWAYAQAGNITAVVKTQSNQAIITRMANYTELGI
jgi:VCBS repeat-containing protein